MYSYLSHLECTQCRKTIPCDTLIKVSPCCGKVLFARYHLSRLSDALAYVFDGIAQLGGGQVVKGVAPLGAIYGEQSDVLGGVFLQQTVVVGGHGIPLRVSGRQP